MRQSRRLARRDDDDDDDRPSQRTLALVIGLPVLLLLAGVMLFAFGGHSARAVTLETADGEQVSGTVLHESDREVILQTKHATLHLDRDRIKTRSAGSELPDENEPRRANPNGRFPDWRDCIDKLADRVGADKLRQVPATVVDTGSLRSVPYLSHRAGDFEMNVYGDPHAPAGVEAGIIRGADMSAPQKQLVLDLMRRLLVRDGDKATLERLNLTEDTKNADGLVFEVTPPTASDAEGGWWVSVYDQAAVDAARASAAELDAITAARPRQAQRDGGAYDWTPADYAYGDAARASASVRAGGSTDSDPREKRVYVRGYTKKDGTYVAPHERRAPTRHR